MKLSIPLLLFIAASTVSQSFAVDPPKVLGWNKTTWGMSEKQAIRATPGARRANVKREMSRAFHPTLYVFARIDTMLVSGVPFRVDLLADSATRTLASVETSMECSAEEATKAFATMQSYCAKRYGNPTSKDATKRGTQWWMWNLSRTKIFLSDAPLKDGERHRVSVSYHVN